MRTYYYVVNTFKDTEPVQLHGYECGKNKEHVIIKLICKDTIDRHGYEFLVLKRKWFKTSR
jgi:hypothetical protein